MHEDERLDPAVATVVTLARRPVSLGDAARARVILAVQAELMRAPVGVPRRHFAWALAPRSLRLSPVATTLLAAGLVGIGVVLGISARSVAGPADGSPAPVARNAAADALGGFTPSGVPVVPAGSTAAQVKFVLVAPHASEVTVVGNFNGWNPAANPMRRTATGGTWSVTVPLEAGRHEYSFVVDGKHWMPDPAAALAPADGFGVANSVLLVSGSTS